MARKRTNIKKPTDAELAILQTVWEAGPSTVREVYELMNVESGMGYTTALKFMQIMTDKGLLECDKTVRPQIFRATRPRQQTQRQLLKDLVDSAFSGSQNSLVLQALATKQSTPEELQQIRTLLDELEEKGKSS